MTYNDDIQSQKAVTAYFSSKQLPLFDYYCVSHTYSTLLQLIICRIMRCEILQWLSVVILWSDLLLFMDGRQSRMKEYQLLYNPLDHSCDYI